MRSLFLSRKSTLLTVVILLLLSALILMSLRVKQKSEIKGLDSFLIELYSPFQKGATFIFNEIKSLFYGYLFLVELEKENRILKQKIARLERENQEMKALASSGERLRKLLQFRESLSMKMVAAEVIGRDPTSWFKSLTLNKGERDGVQKGMAVLSPEGVVGQILKTGPYHSIVLLITDYNSAVDAMVERTRAKAVVKGMGENCCYLKYLLRSEEVNVGDQVITSGLTGNFPKGLPIGEITKIEKSGHGVFQYAELIPKVDFTKLEEVLIVTEMLISPSPEKGKIMKKTK